MFSDLVMPGPTDGIALARTLAERRPTCRVLTTGFSPRRRAAARDGLRLLEKPTPSTPWPARWTPLAETRAADFAS